MISSTDPRHAARDSASERSSQAHRPVSPARAAGPADSLAARRERLLLLCAVDRARLRLVWRMPDKPRSAASSLVDGLFSPPTLATILPWIPGRIGRWSRGIRAGAGLAGILRTVLRVAT